MADYLPVNSDTSAITMKAVGAVTGGLLVKATTGAGSCCHPTSTTDRAIGVAAHDAPDGGQVTVYLLPGYVHEVPLMVGVVATTGNVCICSTTPGRVDTHTVWASVSAGSLVGIFVNTTTGTADGKSGKGRFVGL